MSPAPILGSRRLRLLAATRACAAPSAAPLGAQTGSAQRIAVAGFAASDAVSATAA